ncbi:oligosaccharide flippase family protein [Aeromonas caviae]|uniref:oligosaccharide flippase family protein n=1 Tax=Aeromonas caviae TaxID=648 RepID=UPI00341764B4
MTRKNLASSIMHSMLGKYAMYAIQFISIILVARLYSPDELGYFSVIQIVIAFSVLICDAGLGPALVSADKVSTNEVDSVFTFTVLIGFILAILIYTISPVINLFFNSQNYTGDIKWIAVAIFFQSISIVPNASLIKDRRFFKIANANCCSEIISLCILLILYQYHASITLMSIKFLVFSFFKYIFLRYLSRNSSFSNFKLTAEIFLVKRFIGFAIYQLGFNVINFFTRNLDNILIGKYFGFNQLGYYDRAYQLMRYPLQLVTFALVPAIQPNIVLIKNNQERVDIHNWLAKRLAYCGCIISTVIYFSSKEIIGFLFGDDWMGSVVFLEIFSLMIPVQVLMSSSGAFFQAYNKVNILFVSGAISAATNIIAMIIGVTIGSPEWVAKLLLISFCINFIQTYYCLFKYVFIRSYIGFLRAISPALSIFVVMVSYGNSILGVSVWNDIGTIIYRFSVILSLYSLLFFVDHKMK